MDFPQIQIQPVALVKMVTDQRRQQVVGGADSMEITGEVQVDVLHGHYLGVAAAYRPALDAETWPQRRFAQADHRLLAKPFEGITRPNSGGRLAFASGCWADRSDQNQLAVGPVFDTFDVFQRQLGLIPTIGVEVFLAYPQPFLGQPDDGFHRGALRYLDVGHWFSSGGI